MTYYKERYMEYNPDIVEDEVLRGKTANVIAFAINHIKDDDSEECYPQEELVSALRETSQCSTR